MIYMVKGNAFHPYHPCSVYALTDMAMTGNCAIAGFAVFCCVVLVLCIISIVVFTSEQIHFRVAQKLTPPTKLSMGYIKSYKNLPLRFIFSVKVPKKHYKMI